MRGSRLPLFLLFLVLVAAVWSPVLALGFTFDDAQVILNSDRLRRWSAALEVFRQPAMWSTNLAVGPVGTYRPLALASFVVDYQLFGLSPLGYHLSSLLMHLAAQAAVLALLLRWLPTPRAALALALLCACHPSNVESVAWVNGCSELLAAGFGVAALVVVSRARLGPGRAVLAALLLLGSLLGKESGAVFLVLCPAFAALARQRERSLGSADAPAGLGLLAPALAAAAAAAAYALLRLWALKGHAVPRNFSPWWLLYGAPAAWYHATQAFFLPIYKGLAVLKIREAPLAEQAVIVALGAGALLLLGLLLRRRRYLEAAGLSWWLGAIAPAAVALLTHGRWPGLNRWLYVGLPGLLLVLYGGWGLLARRLRPRAQGLVFGLIAAAWVLGSERAIPVWRNDIVLFATMVEEQPEEYYGYMRLGFHLYLRGRYPEAAQVLQRGVELAPDSQRGSCAGLLAASLAGAGSCDPAEATYRRFGPSEVMPAAEFSEALQRCRGQRR